MGNWQLAKVIMLSGLAVVMVLAVGYGALRLIAPSGWEGTRSESRNLLTAQSLRCTTWRGREVTID